MLPDAARVSEVALTVRDLDRETRFYTTTLGLDVVDEPPGAVRLGAGDHAFLRLDERTEAETAPGTTGLFHFAVLYPTRRDLASIVHRLIGLGHPLQGAADHGVSEAVYLADTEGNGIEVYRDRSRDQWPLSGREVRMGTEPLDLRRLVSEAAAPESWTTPPGTRLGHVHLQVHDVAAAERFYVDALGFGLTQRYGRQASFFSAGRYHHHVGVNTWQTRGAPPAPDGAAGLKWFRVDVPSVASLDAVRASLMAADAVVEVRDGELWTRDVSGHHVAISAGK